MGDDMMNNVIEQTLSSIEVAEMIDKEHSKLLEAITSAKFLYINFRKSTKSRLKWLKSLDILV